MSKYLIVVSTDCMNLSETVDALRRGDNEVGVLLIQDGVYMADKGCPHSKLIASLRVPVYASRTHLEERGLSNRLAMDVTQVDYPTIVRLLMEEYDKTLSL
ncbi:MAG: sulfurtransferase complex subunit TusB [Candidatus Thorarchaeota archaeon]|nr:sulfurtransferase complex subunit TusB [Candidatus Thorarchaeota archaeon]